MEGKIIVLLESDSARYPLTKKLHEGPEEGSADSTDHCKVSFFKKRFLKKPKA
jgi:hypothetical protein